MTIDSTVAMDEVSPAVAARGSALKTALVPETSFPGSAASPLVAHPQTGAGPDPEKDGRVRRFPISFVFEGKKGTALQIAAFDLEPMRLVVCEPTEDCVLLLSYGDAAYRFDRWQEPPGETVHSRTLSLPPPYGPLLWKRNEVATLDVVQGRVSGAAFVARKAGTL